MPEAEKRAWAAQCGRRRNRTLGGAARCPNITEIEFDLSEPCLHQRVVRGGRGEQRGPSLREPQLRLQGVGLGDARRRVHGSERDCGIRRLCRLLRLVSRDLDHRAQCRGAGRCRIEPYTPIEDSSRLVRPAQRNQNGCQIVERDRVKALCRRDGVDVSNGRSKIAGSPSLPRL
jgi:hypothetical protein